MKLASVRRLFGNIDYFLLFTSLVLAAIGVAAIYSSGVDAEGNLVSKEYLKQVFWIASGIVIMLAAALFDFSRFKDSSWLFYVLAIVLLILTRLFGRVVNGAKSWLGIGSLGIQPAEFAKIATVLALARYLDAAEFATSFRKLVTSAVIAGIPVLLILSQPDFGSALVFFPAVLMMLTIADVDVRYILFGVFGVLGIFVFLSLPLSASSADNPESILRIFASDQRLAILLFVVVALAALAASAGWIIYKKSFYFWISYVFALVAFSMAGAFIAQKVLKPYQLARLLVFIDPQIDPRGSGWNILQSITAIGSGGLTGKGFLRGTHSHARFIPQQSTDFIFSILAEEFGFIGVAAVLGLFLLYFMRCIVLIETLKDRYASYVTAGLLGIFVFHFMINVGMAMGIMPVTGIPLFFISYGGSSMWIAMASTGILMGISARRYST